MSKENKWLLIFAGIFLVVGLVATLLISSYVDYSKQQKSLQQYKDMFPTLKTIKEDEEFETTDVIIKKENLYNSDDTLIGKAYTGVIIVENTIPDVESAELKLLVGVNMESKVVGIVTLNSEHTPDFYSVYDEYFLKITSPLNFKIDSIAGSTISGGIINQILDKIKIAELGIVIPNLTLYEQIFGEGVTGVVDEAFVGNEIVTEKAEVYDAEENLLGYTYTAEKVADVHDDYGKDKLLKIMLGVNLDGKVVGLADVVNEHTPSFYNNYQEAIEAIEGELIENLELDVIIDSTRSANILNELFNRIKEVIANE